MSDNDAFDGPASTAQLEKALRQAVGETYRNNPEQLTVKRLRTSVEHNLGLENGFFKGHEKWNVRSKDVIHSEVAALDAQSQPPSSQPVLVEAPVRQDETPKEINGKKRSLASAEKPKKRKREDKPRGDATFDDDEAPKGAVAVRTDDRKSRSSSVLSDMSDKNQMADNGSDRGEKVANSRTEQDSGSELSVLIDEDPKPKKRGRKASSEKPRSKRKEGPKSSKTPQQPTDPDNEEIKRLQGWLVKCGIRKMWFKELAPYSSSKAKVRHLKEMLTEAGMTGRYSQEKATQIREERELKADLEAVQAGNKQWGKAESDEDEDGRPRRRIARGLQELDFLRDDDGEESD